MKTHQTLSPRLQQEIRINIIQDSIVFYRACSGLMKTLAVRSGNEETLDIENRYNGFISALFLMGVKEEDHNSIEAFSELFYQRVDQDIDPKPLAVQIHEQWGQMLPRYK